MDLPVAIQIICKDLHSRDNKQSGQHDQPSINPDCAISN